MELPGIKGIVELGLLPSGRILSEHVVGPGLDLQQWKILEWVLNLTFIFYSQKLTRELKSGYFIGILELCFGKISWEIHSFYLLCNINLTLPTHHVILSTIFTNINQRHWKLRVADCIRKIYLAILIGLGCI